MDSLACTCLKTPAGPATDELLRRAFPERVTSVLGTIAGRDPRHKRKLVQSLTEGQKALLMFVAIHKHNVYGWESFLAGFSTEIEQGFLEEIKWGMEYLGDNRLLSILIRCEQAYYSSAETEVKQLLFQTLDREYETIKEESLKHALSFVRDHPEQFVTGRASEQS